MQSHLTNHFQIGCGMVDCLPDALINEGYHKIKWKVSNKTPVAMYVDSELVPSVFENTHTDPPHLCASRYVNESSG